MSSSKWQGPGLYEFLIEAELQQYYNALKNDLKVQNVAQLKYVSEEDYQQIGMSRPEMRRLKKFFQKHFPTNVLAKMKKRLLSRGDSSISVTSMSGSNGNNVLSKSTRNVAPGRHIIQAESIVIHKTLGSGEFGTVQQGVWTSDDNERIQVAIKCLSQERMENNPVEFLKEAAIMHSVDHEHIVRLYGVVLDTAALMLVTELAPLRSLLECLKEPSMRPNLSVMTLSDFAFQICDGMQYLESKRLIHRDLAARNILVFSRNKVKISDFGLSRALGVGKDYYQTNFNVNLKLPIAWCAPECINFLRFTSASDVWAYGVTLWEMYSYGFQPWAALTGQQILDAIDEPNYQRLERPECCPYEIYYWVMLKCWAHEPQNRPTFAELITSLPECKPEQVQVIRDSEPELRDRREYLQFCAGDIITVLDRKPTQASEENNGILWKGVTKDGKSGLFNPGNSITYLGSSLPSVKQKTPSPFQRNDSRSSSMRKGRLSVDMISGPQGDLKHTGHVGPDGQFFGDLTFLGSKCWVPRQVVSPYKPEGGASPASLSAAETPTASTSNSIATTSSSSRTSSSAHGHHHNHHHNNHHHQSQSSTPCKSLSESVEIPVSDKAPLLLTAAQMNTDGNDHEYHEISDEENELVRDRNHHHNLHHRLDGGVSNPALSSKSQSPLESPRFDVNKSFDLGGPSLVDEVFGALQHEHPMDEAHNVKNELREMVRSKKKFATVKPISSSDRRTLDHAIHLANELASRSMLDLDRPGKHGHTNASMDDISSPRTPTSPSHRRKFSFILGSSRSDRERRNYSQEAASIPDIQSTLTEEAKAAYNSLVEKPSTCSLGFLTPSYDNKSSSFHFPEKSSCSTKQSELFEISSPTSNTSMHFDSLPSTSSSHVNLHYRQHSHHSPNPVSPHHQKQHSMPASTSSAATASAMNHQVHHQPTIKPRPRNLSLPSCDKLNNDNTPATTPAGASAVTPAPPPSDHHPTEDNEEDVVDSNPLRLLRQSKAAVATSNVLPLPPRERSRQGTGLSTTTRHQRKHPLLIPAKIPLSDATQDQNLMPPPPPPKPQRQQTINKAPPPPLEIDTAANNTSRSNSLTLQDPPVVKSTNEENVTPKPTPETQPDTTTTKENVHYVSSQVTGTPPLPTTTKKLVPTPRSRNPFMSYENPLANDIIEGEKDNQPALPTQSVRKDSEPVTATSAPVPEKRRGSTDSNLGTDSINPCSSSTQNTTEGGDPPSAPTKRAPLPPPVRKSSREELGGTVNNSSTQYTSVTTSPSSSSRPNSISSSISKSSDSGSVNSALSSVASNSENIQQSTETLSSATSSATSLTSSLYATPTKVKTIQRVLGSSATQEICTWSLDATLGDSAHAVKLLRLKALLPDSLMMDNTEHVVSVLEMSHWDVARAAAFLLNNKSSSNSTTKSFKLRNISALTDSSADSSNSIDQDNNNSSSLSSPSNSSTSGLNGTDSKDSTRRSYLRPTHV